MLTGFRLKMLNREASSPKNKPLDIITHLKLKKGMVVGDIGSGGGYFAGEFSKIVGDTGLVYAIDVNQRSLDFIESNLEKEAIENVKGILARPDGIELPVGSVDLFFLRNVFHHLPEQAEYFRGIKKLLKSNGKIAIIDYKKKKFSFTGLFGHYTPENVLIYVMDSVGFYPFQKHDFLPDQLYIIFARKS